MIPKTRSSYPSTMRPLEKQVNRIAVDTANMDALGVAWLPRPIFSYELADRMFKGLDCQAMHFENAMEYLYCEVVSPDDGRKYAVKIYPPKD